MTEEEAKTKWCPFVRFVQENAGYFAFNNRGENVPDRPKTISETTRCLGSKCMAWREINKPFQGQNGLVTNGFCGLAG